MSSRYPCCGGSVEVAGDCWTDSLESSPSVHDQAANVKDVQQSIVGVAFIKLVGDSRATVFGPGRKIAVIGKASHRISVSRLEG